MQRNPRVVELDELTSLVRCGQNDGTTETTMDDLSLWPSALEGAFFVCDTFLLSQRRPVDGSCTCQEWRSTYRGLPNEHGQPPDVRSGMGYAVRSAPGFFSSVGCVETQSDP